MTKKIKKKSRTKKAAEKKKFKHIEKIKKLIFRKEDLSTTYLVIAILILIGFLVLLFFGYKAIFGMPTAKTIDELHRDNLMGKLDKDQGYIFNGFSFVRAEGMWFTQIQRLGTIDIYNLQLHYGPRDVSDIIIIGNSTDFVDYNGSYITFDPTEKEFSYVALASGELSINLASILNILPVAACTNNMTKVCKKRPIVTCHTSKKPVISLEIADKPIVIRENKACIRIMGNGTDLVRATDRLLLSWFGIMG